MNRAYQTQSYILRYPLPPPINVPFLLGECVLRLFLMLLHRTGLYTRGSSRNSVNSLLFRRSARCSPLTRLSMVTRTAFAVYLRIAIACVIYLVVMNRIFAPWLMTIDSCHTSRR